MEELLNQKDEIRRLEKEIERLKSLNANNRNNLKEL